MNYNFAQLLEMEQRLQTDLLRFGREERLWRQYWIALEGVILLIGLVTPLIVAYRKSGLYPLEFWVWWCTLTPPLAALAAILMRVTGVQDKTSTRRRQIKRMQHLLAQVSLELPLCRDEDRAATLLRTWHKESHKIELDA
jgi:hypothetical protein